MMLVLYVGLESYEFSKGARKDFTHAVASVRTLIIMLRKLLNHIQSHYHHTMVDFGTIKVPLPPIIKEP